MIEIHLDLQAIDVTRMTGFPEDAAHEEDIYNDLMSILWSYTKPTVTRRYLVSIGLYLSDNFEASSWRVVAFIDQIEVGRMEYLLPEGEVPQVRVTTAQRVSRYQRSPVI